jgi:hypothetical protein
MTVEQANTQLRVVVPIEEEEGMYSVLFRIPHFLTKAKIRVMFAFPLLSSSYWCQWLLRWK